MAAAYASVVTSSDPSETAVGSHANARTLTSQGASTSSCQPKENPDDAVINNLGVNIINNASSRGATASHMTSPSRPSLPPKAETEILRNVARQRTRTGLQRSATLGPQEKRPGILRYHTAKLEDDALSDSSDEEWAKDKPREADNNNARNTREKSLKTKSDSHSRFHLEGHHFVTKGKVRSKDGRVNLSVHENDRTGYLSKALGTGLRHRYFHKDTEGESLVAGQSDPIPEEQEEEFRSLPRLNIVIIVIGSRGDIQPFLKVGRLLKHDHGHRVRIATHPTFKDFVEKEAGLEFFSIGGNPNELMAFMVKNPGLIPSVETVRAGEITRRRVQMAEMFDGMWRACIHAHDDGPDPIGGRGEDYMPFVADAIIANPPSFVHNHIAERLGIPLHIMFTFPWTPTTAFPHPLANVKSSNVDYGYANFMSYPLVELLTWQGLGDLVNKFRVNSLGLDPVSTLWAPGQLYRLKVPFSYMWSPGLVPKPKDYGPNIDICGFVFFEQAEGFKPPEALSEFLAAGPPPIYIGFGSIVVDDPDSFTKMIFEAVKTAGVRALVSKGWGGIGGGDLELPENIFLLDNTPHDWLFPQVTAVVHHGGAGTTAMGLKCGKPTMIVPFFGDQPFWGAMVAKKKAGAYECIPYKKLTAEILAEGIKQCLSDEAKSNVAKLAESIALEGDGAANAVKSFHRNLVLSGRHTIRCSILENRVSVWEIKKLGLRLSSLAAALLLAKSRIEWKELRLVRHNEWNDYEGPGAPISGALGSLFNTVSDIGKGVGSVPVDAAHTIKAHSRHSRKKHKLAKHKVKGCEGTENQSSEDPQRQSSVLSSDPDQNVIEELAHETGRDLTHAGIAMIEMPMNLGLALTQGFHNAPRLYGDETVRQSIRVTGLKSGIRAGRDEFVYGVYDGFTGVATQPYRGAKSHGVVGCLEGVAIGLGGLVLKNISAVIGPFAYTAKGIQKEMQRARQPTKHIRNARIKQGQQELSRLEAAADESSDEACKQGAKDTYAQLPGETLESVNCKVDAGFEIMTRLLDAITESKRKGGPLRLKGRLLLALSEKKWHSEGALESVKTAEVAYKATKSRQDIGLALAEYRKRAKERLTEGDWKDKPTA